MKRRIFSFLLVICMMISMMPVTALAEEVAEDGHDHILAQDTQEETVPVTEETVVETTGEVTEETTVEPTEEVTGETTVETTEEVTEEPTVEITEETTVEETQEATQPVTEPEPVCTCESDDPAFHATNCPCYEAPAEPQCFCVEKCEEPNFWCDICGFDISRCGGEDTAATYEDCTHGYALALTHVFDTGPNGSSTAEKLFDNDPDSDWLTPFDGNEFFVIFSVEEAAVLKSYTLTTPYGTDSYWIRNWKDWTLYGSNSAEGEWTQIQEVRSAGLPKTSFTTSQPFAVAAHTAYTHFKLVVNAIESGTFQRMAELTATGSYFEDGVCTQCNFVCETHDYADGCCKVCGTVCTHNLNNSGVCIGCGYGCSHAEILTLAHVSGSGGNSGEDSDKLFDNNSGSKWCANFGSSETYVIFSVEEAAVLKSYTLTTANDTGSYWGRNWKDWKLYGSDSAEGEWTQIQKVRSAGLPKASLTSSKPFAVAAHSAYTHFKLVVTATDGEIIQQMAELTATGSLFVDGVCTKCNFSCQSHEYENGFCKVCGTTCAHDFGGTDTCKTCGYVCLHELYNQDLNCSLCGAACTHPEFANSVCKECGFICNHTGKYEDGFCTVCGTAHIHALQDYNNAGVCTTCGYCCPHEAVLTMSLVDGVRNPWGFLDGDPKTLWGGSFYGDGGSWIIFSAEDAVVLKSYTLTMPLSAESNPYANWKSWSLYGRNGEEEWTLIHRVKDAQLPTIPGKVTGPYMTYVFYPYSQFKMVVDDTVGFPAEQFYMSDIAVTGFLFKNGSCSMCGYVCQDHTYSIGGCSVCGFACSHESFNGSVCNICNFICPHAKIDTDHKCTVCRIDCPHEMGYDENKCCKACGTPCDHQKGYSDTGFCKGCEQAEPAPLVNGVYKISKAGHLYWFADQVNTGHPDKTNINGELTCDINLRANTPTNGSWRPMGSNERPYQGTLDGKGHSIEDVTIYGDQYVSFISVIDSCGIVRNLGLGKYCSINGRRFIGGICGVNKGLIEGCWYRGKIIDRSLDNGTYYGYCGGIAGWNQGTIQNCWFDGIMNETGDAQSEPAYSGGITGENDGWVVSCYNVGTVRGWSVYGGITGTGSGTVKHCYAHMPVKKQAGASACENPQGIGNCTVINSYYESPSVHESGQTHGIPLSAFSSGELAYKLQRDTEADNNSDVLVWGQNLDNGNRKDDHPILAFHGAPRVYYYKNCVNSDIYSNTERENGAHWPVVNGLCPCCEQADQPEQDEENFYLIGNAGELMWFARKCNESGRGQYKARLTADIALNQNVLNSDGSLNGTPATQWPVIKKFTGEFDGDGHTISGLYVAEADGESAGMFGNVQEGGNIGIVRNLQVADSYISGTGAVGGIVGDLSITGTVENCAFSGKVVCTGGKSVTSPNGTEYYEYAGGLVGRNVGTVENCYANANVSCLDDWKTYAGGLVGYKHSSTEHCYYNSTKFKGYPNGNDTYNGESTFDEAYLEYFPESKTEAQFASGEMAYLMQRYYEEEMDGKNLLWGQTIATNASPVLSDRRVYAVKDCLENTCYSNTNDVFHYYSADGNCTECDDQFCAHSVTAQLAYVSGSKGYGNEEDKNLLDGNRDTKWCAEFDADGKNYVIFTAGDASVISSYTLTTANDTGDYSERNWTSWTLYGSNRADGGWVLIDQVKNAGLPAANHAVSAPFSVYRHTPYAYFKLVLNAIADARASHQMADITIQKVDFHDGVCPQCGKTCQHRNWENGICIICGKTNVPIVILQQPTNGEAKLGERYCVEVQAVGEGLKYQWYLRNAGSKSFSKSSVTDNTYDDVMTKARADREVYCVITDAHGNKVTTDTVKLICLPGEDLAITRQPNDASAKLNETFCVTVEAKGDGLKYQWYWRNTGSENWNVSGQKDNTYDDVMTSARHNREVYCVISDAWGNTLETEIATITGIPTATLAITRQPANQTVALGENFNVTFEAVGDGLKYQWYFRPVGTETWHTSAQKDNSYDDEMTEARHNRELYCVVTDAWGNKVATEPIVTIMASHQYELAITKQPNDDSAKLGENFCVTVEAQGDGLKYQWYWRNVGNERWNTSGQRDNTYDDVMTRERSNREVKCVITDLWGDRIESDSAIITGIPNVPLAITKQPTDDAAPMGKRYCVTVEAQGDNLTYTWYFQNPGSKSWSKSGVTDNTYDDVMTKARANRQVYCVITDALGNQVTTNTVTLNVIK